MVNPLERKKLTISSVQPVTKVGDKQLEKLSYKAKDETGREYLYFTFNTKLFDTIQKGIGQVIDFEIETTFNGEYTNRKVIQAYIGGEPIAAKKTPFVGRGTSPEERLSIESQYT